MWNKIQVAVVHLCKVVLTLDAEGLVVGSSPVVGVAVEGGRLREPPSGAAVEVGRQLGSLPGESSTPAGQEGAGCPQGSYRERAGGMAAPLWSSQS